VPNQENLRRSQRARRPAIPDDYEIYMIGEIQMEGDPHSSKLLEAMEDEMSSMSTNKDWK
jgi:hypothetical protein